MRSITTPAEAAELPVDATIAAGSLTAVKRARQYSGGRPGWWVTGFTLPFRDNAYPVVDRTLFRYAKTWTVES